MRASDRPLVVDVDRDPIGAVDTAAAELESGHVVGLATDTVYGLAARADDPEAIREIYEWKDRPDDRRMAVLVADRSQAAELIDMTGPAIALASSFWPGPLTIVSARRPEAGVAAGAGDQTTIGVRCPADEIVRAVAARVGPLAVTSANRFGASPATRADEVVEIFPSIRVVLDRGERTGGASTVVDVTGDDLVVIRPGPLTESRLRGAVNPGFR